MARADVCTREARVARLARQAAGLVLGPRRDGEVAAAARLEAGASEAVELVRRGRL